MDGFMSGKWPYEFRIKIKAAVTVCCRSNVHRDPVSPGEDFNSPGMVGMLVGNENGTYFIEG
jgi:hypothetical protein